MLRRFVTTFAVVSIVGHTQAFELASADMTEGQSLKVEQVGKGENCSGGNVSPELHWANPPTGTKSFALTVFDPDAMGGKGFWHWGVFNLGPETLALPKGAGSASGEALPKGSVQGKSEFGFTGFAGACPPAGPAHHYIFTLKALSVEKLGLDATATPAQIGASSDAVKLGEAKLTGTWQKP